MTEEHAREYMGMSSLAYITALREGNARNIRNAFSDYNKTQHSLDSMLYLDPAAYSGGTFFVPALSGLKSSPLFNIFRDNGYKINTGRAGGHLLRGTYIDEFTPTGSNNSYCMFVRHWYYLQHLGYCELKKAEILEKFDGAASKHSPSYEEQVFQSFERHAQSDQPWLNLVYIFSPGHTPRAYTRTERELEIYKEDFAKINTKRHAM